MYFYSRINFINDFFKYCLLLYSIFSIRFSQEEQIHNFLHLLRISPLIKGVHKNAITMKIYMSTVIKVSITKIFPYENSNNLRLVFSHCASAQCHRIIKSIILLIRKNYPKCETHKFIMISWRRLTMITGCTTPENITEDINHANKICQPSS